MNEIEQGWEALCKRCCADPAGAKRCVMVSREDFAAAIAAMRGEPVAWLYQHPGATGKGVVVPLPERTPDLLTRGWTETALYAGPTPPDSGKD